jgi:hypothetical protein
MTNTTRAKYQNLEFRNTYCFVFLQKKQVGDLFNVNEAINVFFMTLHDCFINKISIKQNRTSFLSCEQEEARKYQPIETLIR